VLIHEGSELAAFAVCHCGGGTEAGSGTCFVKFGAARPGPSAALRASARRLRGRAAGRGLERLLVGMNTARHEACRRLLARGYRADLHGLTMLRPNEPAYNRPEMSASSSAPSASVAEPRPRARRAGAQDPGHPRNRLARCSPANLTFNQNRLAGKSKAGSMGAAESHQRPLACQTRRPSSDPLPCGLPDSNGKVPANGDFQR
jgi:hypothetical protein